MQEELKNKRKILMAAVAATLKSYREKSEKSITLISNELNIAKSIWSDIEMGKSDMQFSTFMRIIEALNINPETFLAEMKKHLPENFSFIE